MQVHDGKLRWMESVAIFVQVQILIYVAPLPSMSLREDRLIILRLNGIQIHNYMLKSKRS